MKNALLLFIDIFKERGIQTYNRHFCDALEAEFPKIKFAGISLYDSPENGSKRQWHNIDIKSCGTSSIKFVRKILFALEMISTILTQRPEFLICTHVSLSPIALFFKKLCGLRYAILTHGIDCWSLKDGVKYVGLENAEVVTAVSEYTKKRMVENGISPEKIKILYNTVNTSLFYRKTIDRKISSQLTLENKRVLLTIGEASSKERYKGHDIMLEVLKRLGGGYVWVVVGRGDDLPRLKERAREIGVIENIKFTGEIGKGKLVDYYNISDVFVMPSKGEGFGIVFLEAMACGKPVIGGNRDGSREPLMNGKLGFLVDPDNVEEIQQTIALACTTKENRTNPEYLRNEIEKNFGLKVFNRKVKEIFSETF